MANISTVPTAVWNCSYRLFAVSLYLLPLLQFLPYQMICHCHLADFNCNNTKTSLAIQLATFLLCRIFCVISQPYFFKWMQISKTKKYGWKEYRKQELNLVWLTVKHSVKNNHKKNSQDNWQRRVVTNWVRFLWELRKQFCLEIGGECVLWSSFSPNLVVTV